MVIRKLLRIVEPLLFLAGGTIFAFVGWIVFAGIVGSRPIWPHYVYAIVMTLLILRNFCHRYKWYVRSYPAKIRCYKCHTIVPLTRYGEKRYLKAPLSLYIPPLRKLFNPAGDNTPIYKMLYRPYLQLDCPECGEKQVICPYCHEPIPQESVVCKYDKPSKCPHCGKKIYTPVPVQDWDDAIIVG